jgi:APA family basic amino acid/polyamine antiporter
MPNRPRRARTPRACDPVPGISASRPSLGVMACTAIVVGNMVGAGFYLSPSALAPYGLLAVLAWVVMGIGAGCLGLAFARLARMAPATGGPYAYTRIAYGDFAGFLIGWGYWISIWASLPAIAFAFTGSFLELVPAAQGSRPIAVAITVGAMWLVVTTNLRGVKTAGFVASLTTYTKLIPFGAIALLGLFSVHGEFFSTLNPSGKSLFAAAAALAPLTMFAYLGLESATVPAGDVVDPGRTIPRATLLGVGISSILYVLGTIVVLGVVPREQLVGSTAPFGDVARLLWGSWAAWLVSAAVVISTIGSLNGWTLLMGQVPMAAADDGLFPVFFGRRSVHGVPAIGIVISAGFATGLVLVQASGDAGFAAIYSLIIGLATLTAAIPYAFCALAGTLIALNQGNLKAAHMSPVDAVAFVFSLFVIYGCGAEAVLYGLILLLLGIPVYVWQRHELVRQIAIERLAVAPPAANRVLP